MDELTLEIIQELENISQELAEAQQISMTKSHELDSFKQSMETDLLALQMLKSENKTLKHLLKQAHSKERIHNTEMMKYQGYIQERDGLSDKYHQLKKMHENLKMEHEKLKTNHSKLLQEERAAHEKQTTEILAKCQRNIEIAQKDALQNSSQLDSAMKAKARVEEELSSVKAKEKKMREDFETALTKQETERKRLETVLQTTRMKHEQQLLRLMDRSSKK